MMRPLLVSCGVAVAVAGCGSRAPVATEPYAQTYSDVVHGIAVTLPPGWQRATTSLTPSLSDPREVLSVGTFALRYRETGCAHMPTSALEDLGPADAFITLEERGLDPSSKWTDFPQRPAHFGPELGGRSEASECAPTARFTDHWFGFTDGGRHFHVLVAFGPNAPDAAKAAAWRVLDSLQINAGVKPDWHATG